MILYRIKTNIIVNLFFLLAVGMLLIDIVMIVAAKRVLLINEINRATQTLSAVEMLFPDTRELLTGLSISRYTDGINNFVEDSGYSCVLILNREIQKIFLAGKDCGLDDELDIVTRKAIYSGQRNIQLLGSAWAVLWSNSRHMIVGIPIFRYDEIVAGVGVVLNLDCVYQKVRQMHHIFLIYILLNTVILTFAGYHSLSKVTIKPVNNLLKKVEEYHDEDIGFSLDETSGSEFNQLSKALNRMLQRISRDRESLRQTVSSLEKANQDLIHAQNTIIRAEKMASVGRLASGIAHEIGNPIGIVLGYLDLLKRCDISDEERNDFILRSEKEITRISGIVRQLLDFSRYSGEELRRVSVHELIADIIEMFKFQPNTARIELSSCLNAEHDTIMANPDRLRQVFINLLMNSVDAVMSSEAGINGEGNISVSTEIEPGQEENSVSKLKVIFSDNGPGIPEAYVNLVFDPFYTTKEPGKGTGLGLSVSLTIIESFGGTIDIESEPGKGASFIIRLPVDLS